MIRATKLFVQVLLVMAITACAQNPARSNLQQASLSISNITGKAMRSGSTLPLAYLNRANSLLGAANAAHKRGNYGLADMYTKLALSEARVANAATETATPSKRDAIISGHNPYAVENLSR